MRRPDSAPLSKAGLSFIAIAEQGCTGFAGRPDRWQHHCQAALGRTAPSIRPDFISGRDTDCLLLPTEGRPWRSETPKLLSDSRQCVSEEWTSDRLECPFAICRICDHQVEPAGNVHRSPVFHSGESAGQRQPAARFVRCAERDCHRLHRAPHPRRPRSGTHEATKCPGRERG